MSPNLLSDLQNLAEAYASNVGASARRSVWKGTFGIVTGIAGAFGAGMIAVGTFLQIEQSDGPLVAGLWVGGAVIAIAAVVAAVAINYAGRRAKRLAQANLVVAQSIARADVAQLIASAKAGGSSTLLLAAAALVAGISAGRRQAR
ncbi:MAG: hypothetical protein H6843_01245 [Rhodospirillaceae bacterium]|nr:hypothetical protein [Rhodospirillaceae bacterium]